MFMPFFSTIFRRPSCRSTLVSYSYLILYSISYCQRWRLVYFVFECQYLCVACHDINSWMSCHTHTHTHTQGEVNRDRETERGGGNVVWLVSCQQKLWRTKSFIPSFHSFTRSVDVRLLLGAYRARHLLSAVSCPPRVGNSIVMRALNRLKHVYTTTCKTRRRPSCGKTICYRPFSHFRWVVGVRSPLVRGPE